MTYRCPKHGTEWYTEKCGACEVAQQQAQVDRIASLETALASATVVRDAYHSRADAAESRVKHAEAERDACRAQVLARPEVRVYVQKILDAVPVIGLLESNLFENGADPYRGYAEAL